MGSSSRSRKNGNDGNKPRTANDRIKDFEIKDGIGLSYADVLKKATEEDEKIALFGTGINGAEFTSIALNAIKAVINRVLTANKKNWYVGILAVFTFVEHHYDMQKKYQIEIR